jgi:putative Mg2+ transporter-C (MgtC) family protein
MNSYEQLLLLGKVILAGILAGVVGLEREFADKPAGLRTHMLVGASSAMLVGLAIRSVDFFSGNDFIRTDPIRIIEAIVVGISFLGAGTILKKTERGNEVEGLTTSASILSVAAIGVAVGLNALLLAAGATVWNVFVNSGLRYLAEQIKNRRK